MIGSPLAWLAARAAPKIVHKSPMMPTNGWPALGVAVAGLVMTAQIGWRATLGGGNNAFGGSPWQAPPNTAQNAPTGPCNMRTSDARTLTFAELRSLLVDGILGEEDPKPLLIRHTLSTWPLMHWLADAESLANGTAAEASALTMRFYWSCCFAGCGI